MRILHIVPSLDARHGGPSQSVRALANHQALEGDMVELLTTRLHEDVVGLRPGERIVLRSYPRVFPRFLARSPGVERHISNATFHVLHHHSIWLRTLAYATAATRQRQCPLVISPRGMMSDWAWAHRRWRKQLATWFVHPGAFQQVTAWHATSHEEAQDIRRRGFSQPICVAPNGVFLPIPDEITASRMFWREMCPATAERPVALFYSRLHRKKRVRELIDLWLSQPRGDWLLLVVGTPEDYTAEGISAEIQARGESDRVVAFDGTGHPPPYGVASLFLLPSHSENFGLVIAEALAAGVPALVTDSTPWLKLGEHEAGWCVAWEEYGAALAKALDAGPEELTARGMQGRRWMAHDFSWERVARTLHDFYLQLRHE